MNILVILALGAIVLFVGWRIFLRTQGEWIDMPSDPHEYVKPELAALVDWLATQAEAQIWRGHAMPLCAGPSASPARRGQTVMIESWDRTTKSTNAAVQA